VPSLQIDANPQPRLLALLPLKRWADRSVSSCWVGVTVQLSYESTDNSLRLTLAGDQAPVAERIRLSGYVDMGVGGRLVGLEMLGPTAFDLRQALARWLADTIAGEYLSVADDSAYIELSTPEESSINEQTRAAEADFGADLDSDGLIIALSIPRHGTGYEITYPSGNQ
jgi:hypothetical protein